MAGVGAGTGAMGSLLGKLGALLGDKYKLLKRVRKEIEFLKRELGRMQAVLVTLADVEKLNPVVKDWRDNVRDLSYLIEDCIDRFMVRLGNGDARRGFMKKTARQLKTIWARHDIASQIQELKALVVQESELRDRYKLEEEYRPAKTVEIDSRLAALYEEVKGLVAIAGPMEEVISWLKDDKVVELKVVAIVGPGGLGKTTLAMEVYRNIGGDFQCRASVSVSRTLNLEKLLKDILSQIDQNEYAKCQRNRWEKEQLIPKILQILTGKRYFIVIDDVWKKQDWDLVKAAFPENRNGSRIIATTRSISVANSCCSNSGDQVYQMAHLNDVDSRRLFFKRTFCSDNSCPVFFDSNSCPVELEEVCTNILKRCGGLPLAIITIASLLANKSHDKVEWERLQNSIGVGSSLQIDSNLKGIEDILLLSYWDLPHHLKTCLLYLCIYPEDYHIPCEDLKWKWIAEGFVNAQRGSLDQVAENYFNELVNRNMIQLIDADGFGSVEYCRVHDMVLDLIVSLSDEENFATVLNGRVYNSLPSKIRRISMQSGDKEHKGTIHTITETKLHVRSLNVFGAIIEQIPPLADFHALRVLDFQGCKWLEDKHVKNIGSLCQLRYFCLFCLDGVRITELPRDIGKLQYLETLDLRGCDLIKRLPSTVVQLPKLLRLSLNYWTKLPADMLGSMEALKELIVHQTDNEGRFAEELVHLTALRKLDMGIWFSDDNKGLLNRSLSELSKCNLRCLRANGDALFRDPSCTYPCLRDVDMMSYTARFPKGMASLKNVVTLRMEVGEFDEKCLHVLMGMPSLEHLYLTLYLATGVKEKLVIGSNGFKRLKVFHCFSQAARSVDAAEYGMDRPAFAAGAMPALRRLRLEFFAQEPMGRSSRYCGVVVFGIEHLSVLTHLHVEINCYHATPSEVETAEALVEKAIGGHPIRRTLNAHVRRSKEDMMFKDDKEAEGWWRSEREASEAFLRRHKQLSPDRAA